MSPARHHDAPAARVPEQDVERLLLLSLIRIHLRRASTEALQALERDLQDGVAHGA
jgi:hypothetical protein